MKRFRLNIIAIFVLTLMFGFNTNAQQFKSNTELGLFLGGSYYLGDLNTSHFNDPLAASGLIIRKNIDKRFSYKAEVMYLNLRSYDNNPFEIRNPATTKREGLHFRSQVYELSGQLEFNFLPYQPGNPLHTWTPFIYTGLSLFYFKPQGEDPTGQWRDLQELGTEGQGTQTLFDGELETRKKYSLIQFAIPIGGGMKIAVSESFNIIFEYGFRKTFTDYIDDVSTTYVGPNITTASPWPIDMSVDAIVMSDQTNSHKLGDQRGDPDKKDWYSFAGVTLSFKLDNEPKGCYP